MKNQRLKARICQVQLHSCCIVFVCILFGRVFGVVASIIS